MKIKRIWHNYTKWEDWKNGFYSNSKVDDDILANGRIVDLFESDDKFFHSACEVIEKWRNCIDYNLTNTASNRKSYLGQVVANYLWGYPSHYTAKVFSELDKETKKKANDIAELAINMYEEKYYNPNHENIVRGKNEKLS